MGRRVGLVDRDRHGDLVAAAIERADDRVLPVPVAERGPRQVDQPRERPLRDRDVGPQGVEKRLLGYCVAARLEQQRQQAERTGLEGDALLTAPQLLTTRV